MGVLLGLVAFFAIGTSDHAQQFAKHSSGTYNYEIVRPRDCESGLSETGYSWSIAGGVMLKETGKDGSTGPVCNDK